MIDFQNKKVFKLSKAKEKHLPKEIPDLLIDGEEIVGYYSALRDYVVFTNKRLIACNVQGITGSKKDFTSLPYSRVQASYALPFNCAEYREYPVFNRSLHPGCFPLC